ncbi:hypothetical protein COTS27_00341 [Spirochaetota bacterium]|nr:hypothetical protein COTS27_00341 [Spirochaetota bacterium]
MNKKENEDSLKNEYPEIQENSMEPPPQPKSRLEDYLKPNGTGKDKPMDNEDKNND